MLRRLLHRFSGGRIAAPPPVIGVLRLDGIIMAGRRGRGLNIEGLEASIEQLFKLKDLVAVAVVVNSPGGAPVQSALIHTRLRQRAVEAKLPIFAFAEDVAASGGYWLVLAGDEVWASETSILGSIGVVSASFGFTELIQRIGIERRVHTAGDNKSLLDPFKPQQPEEIERLKALQADIHQSFKDLVRTRRGDKLQETPEMFAGTIYTGRQALGLGLIDGLGDMRGVLRARFGETVRFRTVGRKPESRLRRLLFGGTRQGGAADLLDEAAALIEERSLWSRFGL
jgi:serine protease SohB